MTWRLPGSALASFWMGGYEGADHVNGLGQPLDMAALSGHLQQLEHDHRLAARIGLGVVRESLGWRLAEPRPGRYDWSRLHRILDSARCQGLQVAWTLMHYGTPADLSLLDDGLVPRFACLARSFAQELRRRGETAPLLNLVNEIGFLAWAVSASSLMAPYGGTAEDTEISGFAVKRRLVCAALAARDAVRRVLPGARFLHIEPLVHVVPPPDRPELQALAARIEGYQWQVWDMLCGRLEPELGGSPAALDLIGVNYYHSGQWEAGSERRLSWHARDPRRRPFADLLEQCWQRYGRPLLVAETGHVGAGRAAWLNDVAAEVNRAQARGTPVHGICLYPLVDRPDWNDTSRWHHSGLWDLASPPGTAPDPALRRVVCREYAQALRRWQTHSIRSQGVPMTTLIVFSHLRWDFVYQRPQHLLSRLAQHYRIVFVEEPRQAAGPARLDRQPQGPDIDVLVPWTPVAAPGFHDAQLPVLAPLIKDYLRDEGIEDYAVWFYTPMALPLMAQMRPRCVVYDCMDELSAFKDAPRQVRQRETALLKLADLVLAGGPALYAARRGRHANVHCLPSAVDAAHFAPGRLDMDSLQASEAAALQEALPHPRLGFFGVIDERLDLGLVEAVARAHPEWTLVMAGPVAKIDAAQLPQRANLHWLGMQPYARLPYLLAGWDLCLMPFALNESTRFISPTKTLEYLAGGKAVVSTPVRDVQVLYGEVVDCAAGHGPFIAACEKRLGLRGPEHAEHLRLMAEMVRRSSWDVCADRIHALLQRELQRAPEPATLPAQREGAEGTEIGRGGPPLANALVPGGALGPRRVRYLVVGAGPTGLSTAYYLGQDPALQRSDVLLVERESRVGGWCRSVQQDGFTFDYAGHIMFSNDESVLDLYQLLLGDNLHWQNREAWIYSHNAYTRYPFQAALYGLPPPVLEECLMGAIKARYGALDDTAAQSATRRAPANFEEFILSVWGEGIARHFAFPYNRKLWTVPLAEMETSWLGGRVPLPDLAQMIRGAIAPVATPLGPNARFGYPLRGGFQALMDGFPPRLEAELALNTSLVHLSPAKRLARLDDGRIVQYDKLISTMPLPRLVGVCGEEAPAPVQAAARALRQVSVRCVHLGIALRPDELRLSEKHWIYYPEDTVFHRIFLQGNASPHCSPPGGFGLSCEISYSEHKPLPCEGSALVERAIADCRRVGIIDAAHRVTTSLQLDMPGAYVVYDHARAKNVALVRDWLSSFGIVLAGRYSEWEYYNSDHAFLAGRKAARLAQEDGAAAAPKPSETSAAPTQRRQ